MLLRRFLLLMLAVLPSWLAYAQGYTVSVVCSQPQKGSMTLTLYDGDSTSRSFRASANSGSCSFEGSVAKPTLASLSTKESAPLYFYIENANLRIDYNSAAPTASRITGSRANSQFRYILEGCNGATDCLKGYVKEHTDCIFAPFLLSQYVWDDNDADMAMLFDSLQGDATRTYHYHLLQQRIARLRAVTVGQKMPNFVYYDSVARHFDSLRPQHPEWKEKHIALLIGATWCEQCQRIEHQLQAMMQDSLLSAQLAYTAIAIDRSPKGWETPFIEQLSISMVPYIILLDPNNRIVARDVRIWELQRTLQQSLL